MVVWVGEDVGLIVGAGGGGGGALAFLLFGGLGLWLELVVREGFLVVFALFFGPVFEGFFDGGGFDSPARAGDGGDVLVVLGLFELAAAFGVGGAVEHEGVGGAFDGAVGALFGLAFFNGAVDEGFGVADGDVGVSAGEFAQGLFECGSFGFLFGFLDWFSLGRGFAALVV